MDQCTSGRGCTVPDSVTKGDSTPAKGQGCRRLRPLNRLPAGSGEAVMAGGVPVATTILRKRRVTGASLSPALAPFSERLASSRTRPVGDSSWLQGGRSPNPITLHPWSPRGPQLRPLQPDLRGAGDRLALLSPRVSSRPRTGWPPSAGWPCGWHTARCACPRPAIGRTSRGRRRAGESSASSVPRRSGLGSGH